MALVDNDKSLINLPGLSTYDNLIKARLNNCIKNVIYYEVTGEEGEDFTVPGSEINDTVTSAGYTWSSDKINSIFNELNELLVGKSDTSHTHTANEIGCFGPNIITDITNDTVEWWKSKGTGWSFIGILDVITDQPKNYGFIMNFSDDNKEVFQLWLSQPGGEIYKRGGNNSGWNGTWEKMATQADLNGKSDTGHTHSTGTASTLGLRKLYTSTGTATDGTMTQNAINTELNKKLPLSGGTMTGSAVMKNDTDYTTSRARNIKASTTDLTAGESTLDNGSIYLVYE